MTIKQFKAASRRGEGAVANPVDVPFEYEVTDGEYLEMVAHPPTTGQLALFFAKQTEGGTAGIRALFDFLSSVLPEKDYKVIEDQLHDGLDVAVIIEIVQYLTEQWSERPTKAPGASSRSRAATGKRSTARPPAEVSTTSNSHGPDS